MHGAQQNLATNLIKDQGIHMNEMNYVAEKVMGTTGYKRYIAQLYKELK
jgi:hypothetical protein